MYVFVSFSYFFFFFFFFFFNDTATTEIYTLSLHDALPIFRAPDTQQRVDRALPDVLDCRQPERSEEHTSELQSLAYLVCRLLLEKKKTHKKTNNTLKKKKNTTEIQK